MSVGNRRMKKFVKREWKIDGTEQQMKNVTVEFECVSLGREKRQTVSRIKFFLSQRKKFCNKKSSQGCFYGRGSERRRSERRQAKNFRTSKWSF